MKGIPIFRKQNIAYISVPTDNYEIPMLWIPATISVGAQSYNTTERQLNVFLCKSWKESNMTLVIIHQQTCISIYQPLAT